MFEIEIQNDDGYPVDEARLRAAMTTTLEQQHAQDGLAITVVITDDESVAELNAQYRGIDAATDVLSFPAGEPPVHIPDEPPYLGDLVIAFPYASAQAEREGHVLNDSLALLVVHGTLHLLGFDHDTPARRAVMWDAQAQALTTLKIPLAYVPALESDPDDEQA